MLLPANFRNNVPATRNALYSALGNPGVGKTSEKIADAILYRALRGASCVMVSNLHNVKNTHVEILAEALGPVLFRERVRVVSGRNLNAAAQQRTLPALVWRDMGQLVFDYEKSLTILANEIYLVNFLERIADNQHWNNWWTMSPGMTVENQALVLSFSVYAKSPSRQAFTGAHCNFSCRLRLKKMFY